MTSGALAGGQGAWALFGIPRSGAVQRGQKGVPALCFPFFFLFSLLLSCSPRPESKSQKRVDWPGGGSDSSRSI